SWCGSKVLRVKVRGGFSVGRSFGAGGSSTEAAPGGSAGAAGASAWGFFSTRPSSNQESRLKAAGPMVAPSFFPTKSKMFPPALQPKQYQAFFKVFTWNWRADPPLQKGHAPTRFFPFLVRAAKSP